MDRDELFKRLTQSPIVEACERVQAALRRFGVSVEDVRHTFRRLGKAARTMANEYYWDRVTR